jgi:DNA invertase Pin-like site-specific DNA recombinase
VSEALIGYARVSTSDQYAALQVDELRKAGCIKVFTDHASGSKASRPELDKMLNQLREGDVVVVWRLDRLGRSLKNLIETVEDLATGGVGFRSLSESIDTTTAKWEAVLVHGQISVPAFGHEKSPPLRADFLF